MPLSDIDPQTKTLATWGLVVLGAMVTAMGGIAKFQWDAIAKLQVEQGAQLSQIRVDQLAINARQDVLIERITDKLNDTSSILKEAVATVRMIDERGTRRENIERDAVRRGKQ